MSADEKTLREAQLIMLEILSDIHKLCEKHNLTYWLEAGSLIGAVRHRGFIPWDDDVDIAMPYEDYVSFLRICKRELSPKYLLQDGSVESGFVCPYAKIRRRGTAILEKSEDGNEPYHHGLFVDIFPFYGYDSKLFIKLYNWQRKARERKCRYEKGTFSRAAYHLYLTVALFPIMKFLRFCGNLKKRSQLVSGEVDKRYITHSVELGHLYAIPRDAVFPVKLVEKAFEGRDFYLPNNPDAYLRPHYGDYMKIPPKEKRVCHNRLIYCDRELE